MIIWSGFGFLAGVIPVLCYMAMSKLCQIAYGPAYTDAHSWPGALGTLLGAMAVYVLAKKLDTPTRTLVDKATGETVVIKRKHTLFFIPMEIWAGILAIVSIYILVFKHESSL